MEEVNATTPAPQEVAAADAPLSVDEAVQALLDRSGGSPKQDDAAPRDEATQDEPQAQDDAEPEQAEEADAEGEDETQAQSEPVEYEVDVGGHKLKVTPQNLKEALAQIQGKTKEIEAGATRKFQEASTRMKQAEEFGQMVAQNADLIAEWKSVANELQQIHQTDLTALSDNDPIAAQKLTIRAMQLQQRQAALQQSLQQADAQLRHARQEQMQKAVEEVRQYAQTSIKGWSPEVDKALGEYVVKNRVRDESVATLTTDPAIYEMAVKAFKYDQLQAAKPVIQKRAEPPPKTMRPNAANNVVTSAQVKARDAWGRFEKAGTVDAAVEAYLARQQARKR